MDSSKLAALLKKRQSERAQAKQPAVAPVTQVAVVTPVAPAYPALCQTLQNRKEERKHKPLDREALSEFMEDQKKAVKYQTQRPASVCYEYSITCTSPDRVLHGPQVIMSRSLARVLLNMFHYSTCGKNRSCFFQSRQSK